MAVATDDFLAHFGVKGMHWGVRKDPDSGTGTHRSTGALAVSELSRRGAAQKNRLEVRAGRPMTAAEKKNGLSTGQKVLIGVGVGSAALGLAFAARYGAKRLPDLRKIGELTGNVTGLKTGLFNRAAVKREREMAAAKSAYDKRKADYIQNVQNRVSLFAKNYEKRSVEFETNPMTRARFDKLSDTDVTVPSGTIFKRLAIDPNESMNKRLFVSFTEADNDRYAAVYGETLKGRTGQQALHLIEMRSGATIKSPSEKKRVELLMSLVDENKTYVDATGTRRTTRNLLLQLMDPSVKPGMDTTETTEDLALRSYNMFARNLVGEHSMMTAYFDRARRAGYNAIVDDNDAGQLADVPMILLNPAQDIVSRQSTEFTKAMMTRSAARLEQLAEKAVPASPTTGAWDPFGDEL